MAVVPCIQPKFEKMQVVLSRPLRYHYQIKQKKIVSGGTLGAEVPVGAGTIVGGTGVFEVYITFLQIMVHPTC